MQRFDHRPGGDLVWCRTCGQQFTRTQYRVHGHNPNQSQCGDAQCSRAAVGYVMGADLTHYNNRGAALLCGPHLLERRRKGSEIHIVDGSRCRQCGGTGEVQTRAESVDSASVRWLPCPHCQGSGYDPDPPGQAPASPPQRPAPPRVDPTVAETLGDLERRYEAPREPRPAPQPAPPTPSKQPPVESPPQRVEQQEPVQRPPPPRQAQQPPRETRPQPSQQGAPPPPAAPPPPPPAAPPPRELGDPERRPPTSASRQQGHGSSGGGCSGRLVVWLVLIALSGIGGYVASNDDLRGRIAGAFGGGATRPRWSRHTAAGAADAATDACSRRRCADAGSGYPDHRGRCRPTTAPDCHAVAYPRANASPGADAGSNSDADPGGASRIAAAPGRRPNQRGPCDQWPGNGRTGLE